VSTVGFVRILLHVENASLKEEPSLQQHKQGSQPLNVRKLKLYFSLMALTSQVMPTDINIYVVHSIIVVGTVFYIYTATTRRTSGQSLGAF